MSRIDRSNQGGSITLFVTISIILALILFVSIYFLVQRGEKVRHDDVIAVVDQQFESDKTKNNENKSSNNNKNENTVTVPDFTEDKNNEGLPTTGSEFNMFELLGVGFLTFSIFGYLKSINSSHRSL